MNPLHTSGSQAYSETNPGPGDPPGTGPGGYYDQDSDTGRARYQQLIYRTQRAAGNIESIPDAERTDTDRRAYLKQLEKQILEFAPDDGISCIAPGDQAFAGLIATYNVTLKQLGETYTVTEKDFHHAPFCAPGLPLGPGPRS